MDREQLTSPLTVGTATFMTVGAIDMIAGGGPAGLIFLVLPVSYAAYEAVKHKQDIIESIAGAGQSVMHMVAPEPEQVEEERPYVGKRNIAQRLFGIYPDTPNEPQGETSAPQADNQETVVVPEPEDACDEEDGDELTPPPSHSQPFLFSSLLTSGFTPFLDRIYLASLPDGTRLYCAAKDLCHVALAGSTGNGKTSIMRLLMSQLCKAGASVLLLDPHYTRYDRETGEDWTPFTPYLVYDPMECRKYAVIEHYLKQIATVMLPQRLERRANSQKTGKPYFIVLDELPDIVAEIKSASGYLKKILREGRKVGIYVIASSQDFLVKTIFPEGDGAVRACYRTAYYVGGDATTARVLLGVPSAQMPENMLGKGRVMLRAITAQQPVQARVPYVDNDSLYRLLGPSTYNPKSHEEMPDELSLEQMSPVMQIPIARPVYRPVTPEVDPLPNPADYGYGERMQFTAPVQVPVTEVVPMRRTTPALSPELQSALDAYEPGISYRDLGRRIHVGKDKAGDLIRELKERRLIVG